MSNLVAFELEDQQLLVACAHASAGRLQVQKASSVGLSDETDEQVGQRLKEIAGSARGRRDAIAIVSRANAEIRELVVPPAPDAELADIVRFLARNEFGQMNEQWALDYVPFPGPEDSQRRVLATAISPQLVEQLTTIAETAGLRLRHIVFRPYAAVDLLSSRLTDGEVRLIVDQTGDQTDLTTCDGARVITTRTVRICDSNSLEQRAKLLLSEIRRTIASTSSTLGGVEVSEIVVCGDENENESLRNQLASSLDRKVVSVQPFTLVSSSPKLTSNLPARTQRFTSLLGSMVQSHADRKHQIDFLNPRRVVVKKTDYGRLKFWGGLAAAVALFLMLGAWFLLYLQQREISSLDEQLTTLKSEANGERAGVKTKPSYKNVVSKVKRIREWNENNIDWLDQLGNVSDSFYTPDEVIVDLFDARMGNTRAKKPANVTVTGHVKDADYDAKLKEDMLSHWFDIRGGRTTTDKTNTVSYTHLTLPTIYSV